MIIPGDPSQIEDGAETIALVGAVAGNGTGPRESGVPADNGTDHTHRDKKVRMRHLPSSYYITTRPDSTEEVYCG